MNVREEYPGLVEHDATFNTLTEYWEPDGSKLANGMRVLVLETAFRVNLDHVSELDLPNALAFNRWCKVTRLTVDDEWVMFLGQYDDGSLVPRKYRPNIEWLIKRDSVPKKTKIRSEVLLLVNLAMSSPEAAWSQGRTTEGTSRVANEMTDRIMKLFGGTE